jgi:hypothetical protein
MHAVLRQSDCDDRAALHKRVPSVRQAVTGQVLTRRLSQLRDDMLTRLFLVVLVFLILVPASSARHMPLEFDNPALIRYIACVGSQNGGPIMCWKGRVQRVWE